MRMAPFFLLCLFITGCSEDFKRFQSQFGVVATKMKYIELEMSSRTLPLYCGDENSEAALHFNDRLSLYSTPQLKDEFNEKAELSRGVYLYSKIGEGIYAIASIPHDRFPTSELFLIITGKVNLNNEVRYIETGMNVKYFEEFSRLVENHTIQKACFE